MKIKLITNEIEAKIKQNLKDLLMGVIDSVEIDTFYPSKIINYLQSLGVNDDFDNFDCNGWDYDYWINFNYNGTKYCISGGGYYGGITIGQVNE